MALTLTLTRRWRRTTLALHVLCGVGWMGLDLGLFLLLLTGWTTDSGPVAAATYTAARLVVPPVVPALAIGMLLTGVVLGWGTRWGLLQWWWVAVKLVIGVVLTVLVLVLLLPGALGLPVDLTGTADEVRDAVGREGQHLLFPPAVSFVALGVALVLSIWKPWGRTSWRRE
ncbi:hypothetical protein [Nocardioides sp.]|uniref:hypothetical protein n=1 Tax=Nocardioides sp. TaxID=35761 RepID=UPI00271CB74C|nr:hypothetical protein [Nocardioides sp.]MDO9455941.1 hypothetical protein [Nocardioides sp.]